MIELDAGVLCEGHSSIYKGGTSSVSSARSCDSMCASSLPIIGKPWGTSARRTKTCSASTRSSAAIRMAAQRVLFSSATLQGVAFTSHRALTSGGTSLKTNSSCTV